MKCFERLILIHIKNLLPPTLDPLQLAYRTNCSIDDAITTTLHLALTHLDKKDTYVRMLFIDFSSAFNTIIPMHLTRKLSLLGLNTSLCNWILDFLMGRPQTVRIRNNTSSTTTLSTGVPQGCVCSPLLFTLLTHDCTALHDLNHIIKFTDDTTVVGLIDKNDKSSYREEVEQLIAWCKVNNLSLNIDKTKEIVVDFQRAQRDHEPLNIHPAEIVKNTVPWCPPGGELNLVPKHRLHCEESPAAPPLPETTEESPPPHPILTTFYRGTIESLLGSCITAWFGNCIRLDHKSLQ